MFKSHRQPGFLGILILCLAQLIVPGTAIGQSSEPTAVRDFYSTPGLNPFEERKNDSFNESISPFNGILQLSNTDIFLPGNGGMDIRVLRRYQSSVEARNIKQVYGYGWDISFGELRFPVTALLNADACTTGIGLDTRNNPVFITPDGSSEMMVANDASMASASNAILVSKGRYMLACEPAEPPATGNAWVVYSPGGMRYELGFSSQVIDASERFKLYVTRISDPNGNEVRIDYAINSDYIVYITKVYDPGDGRSVNFSYVDAGNTNIRLQSIDSGNQTWNYEYQGIVEYNEAVGALDDFLFYADFDNYHLIRVNRPDGRDWTYEYYTEEPVPDTISIYRNWHHLIKEVNYPYGGRNTYEYQDVFFGETSAFYARPNQVIKTKTVETIGADRISNLGVFASSTDDVWTYKFYPGQGGLTGSTELIGDFTVIQTPVSIETYLHYGYEHTQEEDIWRIGLLISKSVRNEQDHSLYIEGNTWLPQTVSNEPYWNGRGPDFVDSVTRAPLLESKQISQHGILYRTDYSNYDAFGNAGKVVRGGTSVNDSIETDYGYFIDTDLWIVNRPEDETTLDVGIIARQFDPDNGNLLQLDNYGVVSNFTYTDEGDVATEIDANNKVTTYLDYYRGVPRRIEYPESKVITRTVNPSGTLASETSGRGFTTRYDYDEIDRLSGIDFPIHADVSISYQVSNSRLTRTLTRGSYREITRFNSLMKPTEIEKTDLSTGTTITTVNEFDILGRQTFVSKPTYGSYPSGLTQAERDQFGVTTRLDPLGRELETRNPDGSRRTTAYHNQRGNPGQPEAGSVVITDERNNVTINRFYGYGSPDDNRLYRIEAPENMTTTASYDKPGNITRIWQGEQGGTGHERLYNFDSRFFLVSEDHPEIGHIVFGRDAVGNMVSRQVKNSDVTGSSLPDSETTLYVYDGLNRLTNINYPGGTPDVSYSYDADDNVKTVSNSNSTLTSNSRRTYAYDENGNLISENITIDAESYSLGYGYNNLDFLDTLVYPSTRAVIYENDAFGRPARIVNYVDQVSYFPGGQKQSVTYVNGMSTSYELNNREWVSSIKVDSSTDGNVSDLSYFYDGRGNVSDIIDGSGINTRRMTYDGLDRLITASGMWGDAAFAYDHEDNMTARTVGSTTDEYTVGNNRMLQLRRNGLGYITPSYDVYGNQLKTANRDLLFNDASNLVRAQKVSGLLEPDIYFTYDGNNRRVAKKIGQINPAVKHYIYSKGDVVFAEIDFEAGTNRENIYLGKQIVASTRFDSSDPVAVISAPVSVLEKVMVTLDGAGSFDPDGTIEEYQWSQKSGTPVTLVDLGAGMAQFESPIVVLDDTLVFELLVRDNDFNTASTLRGIDVLQTDTDGDGLSDLWEEIYFPGDLTRLGGAGSDIDNDGLNDLEEFRNGTHPVQFDALDAPGGILATSDLSSVNLAWPAVRRATRYAVYSSSTPVVPITESNRTYTSSSPFVQDDLNSGQFIFYVIIAERLDQNGALLGASTASEVVAVKVGWDVWSQNVIFASLYSGRVGMELDDQGEAIASWKVGTTPYPDREDILAYSRYDQENGWSGGTTSPDYLPLVDTTRVVENPDGFYAEYYVEGTGWTNAELIYAADTSTWNLLQAAFNRQGDGLVTLRDQLAGNQVIALDYSPQSGWGSPVTLAPEEGNANFYGGDLYISNNGTGYLLYSSGPVKLLRYDPVTGWGSPIAIGPPGTDNIFKYSSFVAESGHLHIFWSINEGGTYGLWHQYLDPAGNPGNSTELESSIVDIYDLDYDLDVGENGNAVAVWHVPDSANLVVRRFDVASGWQAAETRPIPTNCVIDDYPEEIADWYDSIPTVLNLPPEFEVAVDVETNEQGVVSVLAGVSSNLYNSKFSPTFVARYEPATGWLDNQVLHCPIAVWSAGVVTAIAQDMNKFGTTFVIWDYVDADEGIGDLKVLGNKIELLKGVAPVAHAGPDQSLTEGGLVTLDGSLSTDPDNQIVAYQWAQKSGPPVNIADSDMQFASFVAPLVDAVEVLSFSLTVTDNVGNQSSDIVEITITNFSSNELAVVLSSDKSGPLTVGEIVNLSAQGAGGLGGDYEFQFRFKPIGSASGPWVVLQDFDNTASAIWDTSALGGKFRLQVKAREVGNEALTVKDSITIWVNSALPLTDVSLGSDAIGPQLEGYVASLQAAATVTGDAVEYRFELKNTDLQPGWILLLDYSTLDNLAWNSSGYLGRNRIRVSARKAGSLDKAVVDTLSIWINAADAVTAVVLTPSLVSPQPSGTGITFNAAVNGGNGAIEYRFSSKDTETLDEWVVLQNWSPISSLGWDTTGLFGKQRLRVEARNEGSDHKAVRDRLSYWLNNDSPLEGVSLQTDLPNPVLVGPVVNLTAVPNGGSGLYEYQFRVKSAAPGSSWGVLRDFDADPTAQISSVSFIGKNKVQVRARNQGTLDKEVKDTRQIWVNQLGAITGVSMTGSNTRAQWGEYVTFNLSLAGGDGSFYMAQELKRPGEEFVENGYFSLQSSSSFDFYVGGMMPGTYRMRVQVINSDTDKPVKSNSVRFRVFSNSGLGWQEGGDNYDQIQSCTVYECTCAVFNSCDVDTTDPGIVFGNGY